MTGQLQEDRPIVMEAGNATARVPFGAPSQSYPGQSELRRAFDAFFGQTFYGQMLSAMRRSLHEPAYLHGGRAERVFQQQLDQTLGDELAKAGAGSFTDAMFELQFVLPRA